MGSGAVNGHSRDLQDTGGINRASNNHTIIHNTWSGEVRSAYASTTTFGSTKETLHPTDRSKVKSISQMKMSCETCSVNFTLFKRKKCCQECHRFFCSNCLPKPPASSKAGRQCSKCHLLVSGHFSRDDLQSWKVKDMRCFLNVRNISTKDCREKHDLIELVLAQFCTRPRQSVQDHSEHEKLVQEMAAHVRNVNFVNSNAGNSSENSPVTMRNENRAKPQASSPLTPSSSASVPQSTSARESPSSSNHDASGTSQANDSMTGSVGMAQQREEHLNEAENKEPEFEISSERLRELLESMERIQEVLAQREVEEEAPRVPPIRRLQLDDITEVSQVYDLSIRQLKELLVNNFVDYKGCCEKPELMEKAKRLWKDHQENKIRAERIHKEDESVFYGYQQEKSILEVKETSATVSPTHITSFPAATTTTNATSTSSSNGPISSVESNSHQRDSLCHICMDSLVDCILLECGHMVTCTQCGKRLADCPVCRQYIVRVVRVFRS